MLIAVLLLSGPALASRADELASVPPETVMVRVNGAAITAGDLRLDHYLQQLPEQATADQRRALAETLVDRLLIEQFLKRRKVTAPREEIDRQVDVVKRLIEMRGGEFNNALAEFRLTEDQLRRTLALPLAWQIHVSRTVSEAQIKEHFSEHRRELDGTRLTGAQIVKVLSESADEQAWQHAETELEQLRKQIIAGSITFADAARQHSQSPSAALGGDLGKFEYTGRLPVEITRVAFATEPGELSPVFRTRFGVHLLAITAEIPGQLSAEDVRPRILKQLGDRLWNSQLHTERERARIQWVQELE